MFQERLWLVAVLACAQSGYGQTQTPPASSPPAKAAPSLLPPGMAGAAQPLPPFAVTASHPTVGDAAAATSSGDLHKETLLPVHPQLVELQWLDDRWQLVDGGEPVKDFGRREQEAKAALYLIRELGLTQRGTIGAPQPVMEYWLADGHGPVGPVRGLHTKPIDLATLRVEEAQKQWVVRDVYQVLFNFGTHENDARKAAAVLRRYHFSQIGTVGQGTPSMLVLLSSPQKAGAGEPKLQTPRMTAHVEFVNPGENAKEGLGPDGQPVLQRTSPLHPPEGVKKEKDPFREPIYSIATQGRQLAPPNQMLPDMEALVEAVPFDFRQLKTGKDGKDWQLKTGQYTFAHFGENEQAAKQALNVLQFYRCTEQCLVGGAKQPVLAYYLANGHAPQGLMLGLSGIAFHAEDLKVRQDGSAWDVTDGRQTLFSFDKAESAKQVLQMLQKHKFDRVCHIGAIDSGGMTFLLRAN
jgi:hypothetical protein